MSEGQMMFLLCAVYSGALSVVVWANLLIREKICAQPNDLDFSPETFENSEKFKQGA